MSKKKGHIGSSFEGFLKDEGTHEETNAVAVKRVLAWQLEQAMKKKASKQEPDGQGDENEPQPIGPNSGPG